MDGYDRAQKWFPWLQQTVDLQKFFKALIEEVDPIEFADLIADSKFKLKRYENEQKLVAEIIITELTS